MLLHGEITGPLIDAFFHVYRALGHGFLERVYANAMEIAVRNIGLEAKKEVPVRVYYDGVVVGEYYADMVVNDVVVVELKACKALVSEHEAQLLNYLKSTQLEVGFLFNFGPSPQYLRRVFENARKGHTPTLPLTYADER
jgi:GxxExxY protein